MKIVLINPKPKIWIKSMTIPLGIAYIAAVLEKNGYEVKVVDLNINQKQEIPNADVYGITATTPLINEAFKLARDIKKNSNFVILGGPHSTCLPEESLNEESIDFVIRGEGEYSMLQLVNVLNSGGKEYSSIKGLSFKEKGKLIHNDDNEYIQNLDTLPFPAYHLFGDISRYSHPQPLIGWRKPVVNIITSRGCPFDCSFCYKGTFGSKWRARSPENIANEWEYLIKEFRVKEIAIQDDCFNVDIDRCIKLADIIIKKNLKLPWSLPNGIRADLVTEQLVEKLKESGLYRVAIGIESGNQAVLDDVGKKLQLSDVEKAMRIFKKFKIQTIGFFVMGNFLDTEATLQETICFAKKIRPTFAQFSMATPFPGTRLYEKIKNLNSFRIRNWEDYSQFEQLGYFDYPQITGAIIAHYVKKAYKEFYFRLGFFWSILKIKDFYFKIPSYIAGFIHFIVKGK
jgi:radical SAM superfamily enzyme YgiQ (UPF0313 family)